MAKRRDRVTRSSKRIEQAYGRKTPVKVTNVRGITDTERTMARSRGRRGVRARARYQRALARMQAQPSGGTMTNS